MPLRTNAGSLLLCGAALSLGGGACCGLGPAPCTYDIDCSDIVAAPDGENIIVAMDTQIGCPWHVETDESWITLNPPTAHLSDGNVDFDVDANESPTLPRSGTVRVQTTTNEPGGDPICEIAVTQVANPAVCAGLVTPVTLTLAGGPITTTYLGNPVNDNAFDPWDGFLTNDAPCSWNSPTPDSWQGKSFFDPSLKGPGGYIAGVWAFRVAASPEGNQYYKKEYGATHIGTYTACDIAGVPTPLTVPQTYTFS